MLIFNKCFSAEKSPKMKGFTRQNVTLGQIYGDNNSNQDEIILNDTGDVISVTINEKQMNKYPLFKKNIRGVINTWDDNNEEIDKDAQIRGTSTKPKYELTKFAENETIEIQNSEEKKYFIPLKFPSSNKRNEFIKKDGRNKNSLNLEVSKPFSIFSRSPSPNEGHFSKSVRSPKLFTTFGKNIESPTKIPEITEDKKTSLEESRSFSFDDDSSEFSPTKSITSLLSINSENNGNVDVSLTKSVGPEMSVDYTTESSFSSPKNDEMLSMDSHLKRKSSLTAKSELESTKSVDNINNNRQNYCLKSNLVKVKRNNLALSVENITEATNGRFVTKNSVSKMKNDPNWNQFLNKLDQIMINKSSGYV